MITKYNSDFNIEIIEGRLKYLINQIYKLLPNREEGGDWVKPLSALIEEISGMNSLFEINDLQEILYPLICKMEGLFTLIKEEDFYLFRKTIFECLNLMGVLIKRCQDLVI